MITMLVQLIPAILPLDVFTSMMLTVMIMMPLPSIIVIIQLDAYTPLLDHLVMMMMDLIVVNKDDSLFIAIGTKDLARRE